MSERWLLIQHVAYEGPGLIAETGRSRGVVLESRFAGKAEVLPPLEDYGGVVVMGGPMGVYECGKHPFLAAEIRLLRDAVARGLPVLGVCLGAQLLAAALGAAVSPGANGPEIGFGRVSLTDEGLRDPVLGPAGPGIPVFHWHGDTFPIPPGAVHLAFSDRYPSQAFRAGRTAYGFQFHVETDEALAHKWAGRLPLGVTIDPGRRSEIEAAGRGILGRFFEVARSAADLPDRDGEPSAGRAGG